MFLPCDLREWLPADHLVHFILAAVEQIPTGHEGVNPFKLRFFGGLTFPQAADVRKHRQANVDLRASVAVQGDSKLVIADSACGRDSAPVPLMQYSA